ncbi:hypothetical protein [Agarilytica rhodophyticola]|uniref:hypothetical protein n=1 Tax=Agarilytica rhodophyticola TaxID=1737490 RepID=UPI000B341C24|nr:hypothetical protein [Agarilytica rhodophyticola]
MNIRVMVQVDGTYWSGGSSIELAEPLERLQEPIRTTDIPEMAWINGEDLAGSVEVRRRIRLREEAATEIAEALTDILIKEMSKRDTHNGYLKDE